MIIIKIFCIYYEIPQLILYFVKIIKTFHCRPDVTAVYSCANNSTEYIISLSFSPHVYVYVSEHVCFLVSSCICVYVYGVPVWLTCMWVHLKIRGGWLVSCTFLFLALLRYISFLIEPGPRLADSKPQASTFSLPCHTMLRLQEFNGKSLRDCLW